MHLNNALLTQMGRTWWYPPPARSRTTTPWRPRITTTRAQARRVFRRVHRVSAVGVEGPAHLGAAAVLAQRARARGSPPSSSSATRSRWPQSLQRRHGVPVSFGVALWERYNRLILAHSAGLARARHPLRRPGDRPRPWSEQRPGLPGRARAWTWRRPTTAPSGARIRRPRAPPQRALPRRPRGGGADRAGRLRRPRGRVWARAAASSPPSSPPSPPRWPPSSTRWDRARSSPGTHPRGPRGAPATPGPGRSPDMAGRSRCRPGRRRDRGGAVDGPDRAARRRRVVATPGRWPAPGSSSGCIERLGLPEVTDGWLDVGCGRRLVRAAAAGCPAAGDPARVLGHVTIPTDRRPPERAGRRAAASSSARSARRASSAASSCST